MLRGVGNSRHRLLRNPNLLLAWLGSQLWINDLSTAQKWAAGPEIVSLLDGFDQPRSPLDLAKGLSGRAARELVLAVRRLRKAGLLLPAREARARSSRLAAWKGNLASAYYHVASRDLRYVRERRDIEAYLRRRLAAEKRPPQFRRHRGTRVGFPSHERAGPADAAALTRVLEARRTVRQFRRRAVELQDLAAMLRGTWGQTGWLVGGVLGRAPTRTSPSAGALHPIEAYVLAWNVRGLAPGVYHYDVPTDSLRRLHAGSPRATAIRAASGQRFVGEAAFVCIMSAVFARRLWKYQAENSYRSTWLDAGHLAQTFVLLATARGLGAFTTAAIQHTFVERLLGLDGITEFPVYMCGAGVPDAARRSPKWQALRRPRTD